MEDLHIKVEAHPAGYWFIITVLALFGLMCWLSFLDRMAYAGPDEYFILAMALFLTWAVYRSLRYFLRANVSIEADALTYRPFWRPQIRWRYADVERFETQVEWVQPKSYLRGPFKRPTDMGGPLKITRLVAHRVDGKEWRFVLPVFSSSQSQKMLEVLRRKSGKPLELHPETFS